VECGEISEVVVVEGGDRIQLKPVSPGSCGTRSISTSVEAVLYLDDWTNLTDHPNGTKNYTLSDETYLIMIAEGNNQPGTQVDPHIKVRWVLPSTSAVNTVSGHTGTFKIRVRSSRWDGPWDESDSTDIHPDGEAIKVEGIEATHLGPGRYIGQSEETADSYSKTLPAFGGLIYPQGECDDDDDHKPFRENVFDDSHSSGGNDHEWTYNWERSVADGPLTLSKTIPLEIDISLFSLASVSNRVDISAIALCINPDGSDPGTTTTTSPPPTTPPPPTTEGRCCIYDSVGTFSGSVGNHCFVSSEATCNFHTGGGTGTEWLSWTAGEDCSIDPGVDLCETGRCCYTDDGTLRHCIVTTRGHCLNNPLFNLETYDREFTAGADCTGSNPCALGACCYGDGCYDCDCHCQQMTHAVCMQQTDAEAWLEGVPCAIIDDTHVCQTFWTGCDYTAGGAPPYLDP